MQQPVNSTAEIVMPDNLTFTVYAKKDCIYELYTDDGDGYAYENGAYTLETYMWNQSEQILRDSKQGSGSLSCKSCFCLWQSLKVTV